MHGQALSSKALVEYAVVSLIRGGSSISQTCCPSDFSSSLKESAPMIFTGSNLGCSGELFFDRLSWRLYRSSELLELTLKSEPV